jgi:archaellum component FlaC
MSKECDCQYLREVCHIEEGSEIRIEDVFTCLSQVNQDRIDNLNKINENQYEYDRVKAVKEQTLLFKEEVDKLFQVFKSRQNEESEKITTVNELKEKIRHLQMTQESYSKKITSLEDYRMKLIT